MSIEEILDTVEKAIVFAKWVLVTGLFIDILRVKSKDKQMCDSCLKIKKNWDRQNIWYGKNVIVEIA